MCYNVESLIRSILQDARRQGLTEDELKALEREIKEHGYNYGLDTFDYYHVNAWEHPHLVIQTDDQPTYKIAEWGLVHSSAKTIAESLDNFKKPWINNPNAQSETMFEKPTFKQAAIHRRCVIKVNAFYEHHHAKKKTYPFRIKHKDDQLLVVAGIYNHNELLDESTGELIKKLTFSILTCPANSVMGKIHNNPSVLKRTGPRMPVILEENQVSSYLAKESSPEEVLEYCQPYDPQKLEFYTVRNLNNRKEMPYLGNVPEIRDPFEWPDLELELY